MPEIGEIKKGPEIGYKTKCKFAWVACPDCGFKRWVQLPILNRILSGVKCASCAQRGETHWHWKGGRLTNNGYIFLLLRPDNPFFSMADKNCYVAEHRLIMAKYLNRCLLTQETVHHINGIRDDNRLENLELFSSPKAHSTLSRTCQNCPLKTEIRLLRFQIRELQTSIQSSISFEEMK